MKIICPGCGNEIDESRPFCNICGEPLPDDVKAELIAEAKAKEEAKRAEEEARIRKLREEEARRKAEEAARQAEEARRKAEEERKAEEARKAEAARRAEADRKAEEQRRAEAARRAEEERKAAAARTAAQKKALRRARFRRHPFLKIILLVAAIYFLSKNWTKVKEIGHTLAQKVTSARSESAAEAQSEEAAAENKGGAVIELNVGDHFALGKFEQNTHDDAVEPIEWVVIDKYDDLHVLAISLYCLESMEYHNEPVTVTWENSYLRYYLNDDFYYNAFTDEERKRIVSGTYPGEANPVTGEDGGNDTSDYVGILSVSEVQEYFGSDEERRAFASLFVQENRAITINKDFQTSPWYLRVPGEEAGKVSYVGSDGTIRTKGSAVTDSDVGVRPTIIVYLGE